MRLILCLETTSQIYHISLRSISLGPDNISGITFDRRSYMKPPCPPKPSSQALSLSLHLSPRLTRHASRCLHLRVSLTRPLLSMDPFLHDEDVTTGIQQRTMLNISIFTLSPKHFNFYPNSKTFQFLPASLHLFPQTVIESNQQVQ
jgi:hypothetical protein